MMATVWLSSGLFGLYILAFYAGALVTGQMEQWNGVLRGLYDPERPVATAGLGLHFATGGVILALGFVQLIAGVRRRAPALHRWIGRVYVTAALLAGVGGLAFILAKGTIGGLHLGLGFGLYGVLTVARRSRRGAMPYGGASRCTGPGRCGCLRWPSAPGCTGWTTGFG